MSCFSNCPNLEVISFPNATNIYINSFNFQNNLLDEAEINVRRDVKLSDYFSTFKEYIKYVFGPEEAEIVKYEEPKIKPVISIEHPIETKLPPKKNFILKSDTNQMREQRTEQNHQQSKRPEMYLKRIRFLELRLSKYEQVVPFDPSTNNQNEEQDYEAEENQANPIQNASFFMDDRDEEGHEIVSKIGEGNSSIAYKVIDHQHKRVLCKKVLKEKDFLF